MGVGTGAGSVPLPDDGVLTLPRKGGQRQRLKIVGYTEGPREFASWILMLGLWDLGRSCRRSHRCGSDVRSGEMRWNRISGCSETTDRRCVGCLPECR